MKISHLGAKDCVTGSCHLIETDPGSTDSINILVDCGATYGDGPELPFDQFPVPPEKIQYLFLTHAHIDHIGRVPDLIDAGFRGEIICTQGYRNYKYTVLGEIVISHQRRAGDRRSRCSSAVFSSPQTLTP
ncbi:MAG: MBL fold metallo-hydrolase, partial [Desulfobulbus sp.]|nr:MBL fold metallo-hydrolase [Desulfobulbus sp.]